MRSAVGILSALLIGSLLPPAAQAARYAVQSVLEKTLIHPVDGRSALSVNLESKDIAVDSAGNLYLLVAYGNRVVRVGSDGIVRQIAGGGTRPPAAGLIATDVSLTTNRIAVSPAGIVYLSDEAVHQVFKIASGGRSRRGRWGRNAGLRGRRGPGDCRQAEQTARCGGGCGGQHLYRRRRELQSSGRSRRRASSRRSPATAPIPPAATEGRRCRLALWRSIWASIPRATSTPWNTLPVRMTPLSGASPRVMA